jgi:hypothetical protein
MQQTLKMERISNIFSFLLFLWHEILATSTPCVAVQSIAPPMKIPATPHNILPFIIGCSRDAGKCVSGIRLWLLAFILLLCPAKADQVLNQIGGASDFQGSLISSSTNFSITWGAGFTGSFDAVSLRIYNVSTTSAISSLALKFSLADNTGISVTGSNTYGGGATNHISDYLFDLTPLNLSFNLNDTGALYFQYNALLSSGGTVNWSTTDRGVESSFGWTGGSTPGVGGNGQFYLSATPVPEPSTFILLSLAALMMVPLWHRKNSLRRVACNSVRRNS